MDGLLEQAHSPFTGDQPPEPVISELAAATAGYHAVQFYEDDDFLCDVVARFLAPALASGHPAVVIATESHRIAIERQLAERGFDVSLACAAEDLVLLDVYEALAMFMADDNPDPARFTGSIGGIFHRVRRSRSGILVRAYGEMVDVLWRETNPSAALLVEQLWNTLGRTHAFSLLCGYSMGGFYKEAHGAHLFDICAQHSHVVPTEAYSEEASDETKRREIARLQQRARALETEIEQRKELERSLRQALADREQAEAERARLLIREQAARQHAETASRLKDEFLAVVSHELRTPLNAILGWAHIVNSQRTDETAVRRAFEVIERNAKLQLHLIDDLLDISRILTGKMRLTISRVDLAALLGSSLETVRPAAAAKSIELGLLIDDPARFVTGDSDRLQQVMWNLLSNAIKFTPGGGRVDVRLSRMDGRAQIVVQDTGRGIPAAFLPHVFERFRQADTGTTRAYGGLGLGLAVVRYLVEAHGGMVSVESAGEGLGSTFIVNLPVSAMAAAPGTDQPSAALGSVVASLRVLVVDDQPDAREMFAYLLAKAGASVEAAGSVSEALQRLSADAFDLLLADIGMPDQDGYALIEAIRADRRDDVRRMRAIAITSYAGEAYRERALKAGYDGYISKPVDPIQLTSVLSDVCGQPRPG